jgi:hypothetical protein
LKKRKTSVQKGTFVSLARIKTPIKHRCRRIGGKERQSNAYMFRRGNEDITASSLAALVGDVDFDARCKQWNSPVC